METLDKIKKQISENPILILLRKDRLNSHHVDLLQMVKY